jgi:hypothetical protein
MGTSGTPLVGWVRWRRGTVVAVGVAALVVASAAVAAAATPAPRPDARRPLTPAPALTSAAATNLRPAPALGRPAPWLVAPHQISRDDAPDTATSQPDTQVEPSISADPHNGRYLVSVFQQGRYAGGGSVSTGYAHTSDGGRTWHTSMLPGVTTAAGGPFDDASDAVVTFGPDGTVYAQSLVFDNADCRNGVAVQESHDNGATFSAPVFVADDNSCYANSTDKNWITVDSNPRSPHYGRVYAVWDEYNYDSSFTILSVPEIERHSDDGGLTWSPRVTIAGGFNGYPVPLVEPGGALVVVHDIQDPTGCCGPTVLINTVDDTGPADLRYGGVVAAAVDPVTGTLYAAWSDSRGNLNGRDDVLLTHSGDGGLTWSGAAKVDHEGPTGQVDHLTPMVASRSGRVYISYLFRNETNPGKAQVVITRSNNAGATFGPPLALGPASTLSYAAYAYSPPVPFLGDYTGIDLANGRVCLAWEVASVPPSGSTSSTHQVTWAAVLPQW